MSRLRVTPLALLALGVVDVLAPAARAEQPACVTWSAEPRARAIGYDHVVVITNACAKPVACTITTDVSPEPLRASVAAKDRAELVTWRGSPAREFKAKVECVAQ